MSVDYTGLIVYGYKVEPDAVYALPNCEDLLDSDYVIPNNREWDPDYFIVGAQVAYAWHDSNKPSVLRRSDLDIPYEKMKVVEDLMVEHFRHEFESQRPEYYFFVLIS